MNDWNIEEIDEYIRFNTLDSEDWFDSDDDRKIALLNVADRTLERKFSGKTIPIEAVYIFANTLASAYNDTMVQAQRGVASFSIRGIAFTFKDWMKTDIDTMIPNEVYDMVGAPRRGLKYTIMG